MSINSTLIFSRPALSKFDPVNLIYLKMCSKNVYYIKLLIIDNIKKTSFDPSQTIKLSVSLTVFCIQTGLNNLKKQGIFRFC